MHTNLREMKQPQIMYNEPSWHFTKNPVERNHGAQRQFFSLFMYTLSAHYTDLTRLPPCSACKCWHSFHRGRAGEVRCRWAVLL